MPVGERRLLEPSELWPQEQQLCAKAAEGGLLDLRSRCQGEDDPARGREWGPPRRVRAQVLFQLLTGQGPQLALSVVAVRLRGAQVVGRLNLGGWKLRCPLELNQCHLHHRLDLAKAEIPNLSLRGSYLRSRLSARNLRVAHTLNLSTGLRCNRGVVLRQAHTGGQLDCAGGVFRNPNAPAFNASLLTVEGDVVLHKAEFIGEVRLIDAHLNGELAGFEAVFKNPGGRALSLRGLTVDAGMFLRKVRCKGEVRLLDAHINGLLMCDESVFHNPGKTALYASLLTVEADVVLDKANFTGAAVLVGAHINGLLMCDEAVFRNPDDTALSADGLAVDSDMFLRKAQCTGEVRLVGAHIVGQLDCEEAILTNPNPNGTALNAEGLTVDGGMFLRKAQCTGLVRLLNAYIKGPMDCNGAMFSNPDGYALSAEGLTVDGSMFARKAECAGSMQLVDAHIKGLLDCDGAVFSKAGGLAVDLERASVMGPVYMHPASLEGGLDLSRAQVGGWHDDQRTWPTKQDPPAELKLEGFIYDAIDYDAASVRDRLRSWLPRRPHLPQPYEQLAGVHRREGHESAARAVAIGKQRARRADHARWWRRWPSVAWSAVLRWTIGYGYRPALALIPLAVLVLAGSLLFLLASQHPDPQRPVLRPAKPGAPEQPAFNSFRYTMDLLLPVANFKQRDAFVAEGWAAWASFGFTFAGWLLAAIVVAGLSGVFKRD